MGVFCGIPLSAKKICGSENGQKIYRTEIEVGMKRKIVFHKRGEFAENLVVQILFFFRSLRFKNVIQQKQVTRQAP